MATVGNLFINVKARTAAFSKKMKGVRGTIGRLGTGLAQAGKKVALFGAAMGAVALGALTALTLKGLAAVDSMAKLAQSIGASVNSIQALRHVAVIGGTSIESMDKAILKMTKNIGEAAQGYSEATETLEILGLTAVDLEQLKPEEAFIKIANAMNQLSTDARRADAAQSLFGRGGLALLPILKGGSKEIERVTKMMKDFGLEIGDNQARMVERANDAWADTKFILTGLGNLLAVNIAPTLEAINKTVQRMIKDVGGMGVVADAVVVSFESVGLGILRLFGTIHNAWNEVKAGIVGSAAFIAEKMASLLGNKDIGLMAQELRKEAASLIIDNLQFDEMIENLEKRFLEIRRRLQEAGFDEVVASLGDIEITSPDLKGVVDNLQTAIGAFKVEGNVTERQQAKMISIEENQLATLRSIHASMGDGGALV